jgi:hypothetical protein
MGAMVIQFRWTDPEPLLVGFGAFPDGRHDDERRARSLQIWSSSPAGRLFGGQFGSIRPIPGGVC